MDNTEYSVIVSRYATQMLISHAAFLAMWNKNAALRLTKEYRKDIRSLSRLPYRGKRLEGGFSTCSDYWYLIFNKRYLLVYTVKDDNVYVDWVIDGRQDHQWLLEIL